MVGQSYAFTADRYRNWLSVFKLKQDTCQELITTLRGYIFQDDASIFNSSSLTDYLKRCRSTQRITSHHHPKSKKRGDVSFKQARWLVPDSLCNCGTLCKDCQVGSRLGLELHLTVSLTSSLLRYSRYGGIFIACSSYYIVMKCFRHVKL